MGAYDNPAMIRDRSAEIYSQIGGIVGTTIGGAVKEADKIKYDAATKYADEMKKYNADIAKTRAKVGLAQSGAVATTYNALLTTSPTLAEQYQTQANLDMYGVGEPGDKDYVMGSIDAETNYITGRGYSAAERKGLLENVNNTKSFMSNYLKLAAIGKGDSEEAKGISTLAWGSQYRFMGKNALESFSAQGAFDIMNNGGNFGFEVDPTKTINKITNEKGNARIQVGFSIKNDNKEFLKSDIYKKILSDNNGKLPKGMDDGKFFNFNFDKNQSELENGVIIDMGPKEDYTQQYSEDGINLIKGGKLLPKAFLDKGNKNWFSKSVTFMPGTTIKYNRQFVDQNEFTIAAEGTYEAAATKFFTPGNIDDNYWKIKNQLGIGLKGFKGDVATLIMENPDTKINFEQDGVNMAKGTYLDGKTGTEILAAKLSANDQSTIFAGLGFVTTENMTDFERTYLNEKIDGGVEEGVKYYFEGTKESLSTTGTPGGSDMRYTGNAIEKIGKEMNFGISDAPDYNTRVLSYTDNAKKNIQIFSSLLGSDTKAVGRAGAISAMEKNLIDAEKRGDFTEIKEAKESLNRVRDNKSDSMWVIKGNQKPVKATNYDPNSQISNLEALLTFGNFKEKQQQLIRSKIADLQEFEQYKIK